MKSRTPSDARLNEIQSRIGTDLKPLGFTEKGRTFRRETEFGILQIIALQAGQFELGRPLPPQARHLRPNLYGKFTVNLGVFVADIHDATNQPISSGRVINDAHCAIRTRLGPLSEGSDIWWSILEADEREIEDIIALIVHVGLPFLDRFRTRDLIVSDWIAFNEGAERLSNVARLDVAKILLAQGDAVGAKRLFEDHLRQWEAKGSEAHRQGHTTYVRELAAKLGLGEVG
jgi:hypothetical protein